MIYLHKLILRLFRSRVLKKLVKLKNRTYKSANNHKIPSCNILKSNSHNVSKGLRKIIDDLAPIYKELNSNFEPIDLMDLEFYERWLNGRY